MTRHRALLLSSLVLFISGCLLYSLPITAIALVLALTATVLVVRTRVLTRPGTD